MGKKEKQPALLKGWKQIAKHLGQPVATAQRWAKTGMPARREGRFMVASPEELSRWLGREAGAALLAGELLEQSDEWLLRRVGFAVEVLLPA